MKSFPNFLLSLCLFYGCQSPRPDPVIVPAAIDAIVGQDFFTFKKDGLIVYEDGLKDAGLLLGQYSNSPTAQKNNPTQPESAVVFAFDNALSGEHYKLDIDKTGVSIKS